MLGFPANTFVILDTHAETDTGNLQYGGKANPIFSPASDVIREYCGEKLIKVMQDANISANKRGPAENPKWFHDSVYFRGGWRVLLFATCGPAIRTANGLVDVKRLVEKDAFDLIVAFGGRATLPGEIRGLLTGIIDRLGVNKGTNIWDEVILAASQEIELLQVNSVVAVYKERGYEVVHCREIGLHSLPMRPWGIEFAACGTEGCRPRVYEFHTRTSGGGWVRTQCRSGKKATVFRTCGASAVESNKLAKRNFETPKGSVLREYQVLRYCPEEVLGRSTYGCLTVAVHLKQQARVTVRRRWNEQTARAVAKRNGASLFVCKTCGSIGGRGLTLREKLAAASKRSKCGGRPGERASLPAVPLERTFRIRQGWGEKTTTVRDDNCHWRRPMPLRTIVLKAKQ
ncbi:hypothetical protein L210DRAFT_934937 [Boletus edulis BED1]|uniref:Uncharacterized protein n=1 Tax=Boletus edulis BED1 TaxID=1328754 RepID=A0AAD4G8J5_BOLED|nr:hypothetical protein L210DRAFT_934937 [Boletus edulis BED1]